MKARSYIVLACVSLYMVLNWGFMLIRLPPGSNAGIPVAEILLLTFVFTFIIDVRLLYRFVRVIPVYPFVIWWMLGIGRALTGIPEHGFWALRDATHVIESLFLWVGFVFAGNSRSVEMFFSWFRGVLVVACVYGATFPFRETLRGLSPTIQAPAGYVTTIFFHYAGIAQLILIAAASRVIMRPVKWKFASIAIAGALIAYALTVFQARLVYLQVIVLMILFMWQRREAFTGTALTLLSAVMGFVLLAGAGVQFSGRVGETVSLEFMGRHFAAMFGIENEGVVGAARGVWQRIDWWANIWEQNTDDFGSFLFGTGYGVPLIDFRYFQGQIVREPHNSFVSIFGRIGVLGVLAFAWGHLVLIRSWLKSYRLCSKSNYTLGQDRLLLLMSYFLVIWIYSLGQDALEKPYIAVPYYFIWGVVIHYGEYVRHLVANRRQDFSLTTQQNNARSDARPANS